MKRKENKIIYKKPRRKKLILSAEILLACLGLAAFLAFCAFVVLTKNFPRPEKFNEGIVAQSTKIYDRTGQTLLYEISGNEKRTVVSLDKIPYQLIQAVIATEDRNFYQHKGVDLKGIARAILYDLKIGKTAQGASTISQQLIRSYFLTNKKTIQRKTREIILTLELERRYSKNQILEWYFNLIPFGSNLYGVQAASQALFNKDAENLSLPQSATLAALIRAPSLYWPYPNGPGRDKLLARKNLVLDNMVEQGYLTKEEGEKAKAEKIEFSYQPLTSIKAPHFVMFVKDYLEKKYGADYLSQAGLKVITTLDYNLQQIGEQTVKEKVAELSYLKVGNGGLVAVNPKNGELLVMVGSKDFFGVSSPKGCTPGDNCRFDPQVNVAISQRQPGSSFKPIVYVRAFEMGYDANTILQDTFTEFNPNCPSNGLAEKDAYGLDCYHPHNYDGIFKGPISLRSALGQSRNVPAVKTLKFVGLDNAIDQAEKMGITTLTDKNRYGLSLVLGGGEVKLLEMVYAFSIFADDGLKMPVNFIKKIEDKDGNAVEEEKQWNYRVVQAQYAREINDILSDNNARAPVFGLNSSLHLPEWTTAVKTGTTQNNVDGWCLGYTPTLVAGVWVGNNDNTPMAQSALNVAAPIWNAFMVQVLPKFPKEDFVKPY
ncbi:MAG: transglycosylase domain-containing protein [Candidatus Pacebacteria bacterium]|nr:transglycosylase domain-containing protein [Candidatus Paceibacterota bacterium]